MPDVKLLNEKKMQKLLFQMNLQGSGLTLEDLKKAGREEATEVLKELGLTPVQRQRALKDLGL